MLYNIPVKLMNRKSSLKFSRCARKSVIDRCDYLDPEEVFFDVANIIQQPDVAEHLITNVPAGELCVVVDVDHKRSYVLDMDSEDITIVTVYFSGRHWFIPKANQFYIMTKDIKNVFLEIFGDISQKSIALAGGADK